MEYRYTLLECQLDSKVCYGIAAIQKEDGREIVLRSVSDLSCNRAAVAHLVDLCNDLSLSSCHFQDVIEDFLASF